jgi:NTP pyrophosphatase (non-canonical NTP hydrolase)
MTFEEYQKLANSTAIYPKEVGLAYVGLGLGEAGEIQNKIKKVYRDKNGVLDEETAKELAKEYGDLLWYIAQGAKEIGFSLDKIASDNIQKLLDRKNRNVLQGSGDNR